LRREIRVLRRRSRGLNRLGRLRLLVLLPGSLLGGANLVQRLLSRLCLLGETLSRLCLFGSHLRGTGFLGRLCLLGSHLHGASLLGCLLQFPCLLRRMLRGLGLLSSLTGSLLCSLLSGLLNRQLSRLTGCFLAHGVLHGSLLAAGLFAGLGRSGSQAELFDVFCRGLRPLLLALLVQRLLDAHANFFASLRPCSGKVSVLGAVEIGPGVQSGYILWSLVLTHQRFAIRHPLTPGFHAPLPGSTPTWP